MSLIEDVSEFTSLPENLLDNELKRGEQHVKKIHIPKKSGGKRTILIPPKIYKIFQYYLISEYFSKVELHPAATAFSQGCSPYKNAEQHRFMHYLVRLDLQNFFPSITFDDFTNILDSESDTLSPLKADPKNLEIIKKTCFSPKNTLCIGYPISPFAANVALKHIDYKIEKTLEKRFGTENFSFTRYADDIVIGFSSERAGEEVRDTITKIIESSKTPELKINKEKTRFFNRHVGNAIITGLRICQDGRITLPKEFKDDLRFKLSLLKRKKLNKDEYASLEGRINHCRDVDPGFFTKLNAKYFREIEFIKSQKN